MVLYLIRHGAYASGDSDPGLSPFGLAQARAAGRFLRAQGARPEAVLTSGYRRARETAAAIQEELGTALDPLESRDFTPFGDPAAMRATVEALGVGEALVVGHMCSIGELARTLCPQAPHAFGTCMIVALEREDKDWRLLWAQRMETV
ncbi:MAG TPA: histidine phosphatase family protein [Candidatus Spyradenecus faecavium]|uniref:Histidine phosphatase family protein n=1 Tax=Candidatus Spyradenecus faecavium TaxID=2840947 RepID=A0A9D1T2N1_9BACT|nr:histidine phosphatase family protein [Candidatus Spyradenecus faecavium]